MKNKNIIGKQYRTVPPIPSNPSASLSSKNRAEKTDISTKNTKGNNNSNLNKITKSANDKENTSSKKPKGSLSVHHHGLKKFKKVHRFRCKLCNKVMKSHHEANEHHKANHRKSYCKICGKACNTPSTLERYMYVQCKCNKSRTDIRMLVT